VNFYEFENGRPRILDLWSGPGTAVDRSTECVSAVGPRRKVMAAYRRVYDSRHL